MRSFGDRRALALALASLVLSVAPAASAGDRSTVSLDGGRLTVVARAEPAARVIAEVERVTGVRIQLPDEAAQRDLTVAVHDVPVEQGVRAVLQRLAVINLAVIYGGDTMRFIAFPTPTVSVPETPGGLDDESGETPESDVYDGIETAKAETLDPMVLAAMRE